MFQIQPRVDIVERPDFTAIERVVRDELSPLTVRIDLEGLYPEKVLRSLGAAGAYAGHVRGGRLIDAITPMRIVAQECLSTAFAMWCQNACAWYLENTRNAALRDLVLADVADGRVLGGTGLSNPMKSLAGIEELQLSAERVDGGYAVSGILPYVSNLGPGHWFGIVFRTPQGHAAMALANTADEGVRTSRNAHFAALEGTATMTVRFRRAFIPDSRLLADPAEPFLARIKPGFVLLQTGLALGLIEGAAGSMRRVAGSLGHVNRFLPDAPEAFEEAVASLEAEIAALAETPTASDPAYRRRVLAVRLEAAEWGLRAAQAAMLHTGARGYLRHAAPQRRLREAYFLAILTPAIKHLRKELAG